MNLNDRIYKIANYLLLDSFKITKEINYRYNGEIAEYKIEFAIGGGKKIIRQCDVLMRWVMRIYNKIINDLRQKK